MKAQLSTLTPLPGKKAFVFISGSLPEQPGYAMFYYAAGPNTAAAGGLAPYDIRQVRS